MKKVVKKGDLLELLYTETGCAFLSDLHCPEWLPRIKEIVQTLDANQFSPEQWLEAVRYISYQNVQDIQNVKAGEMRQFLLDLKIE